MEQELAAPIMEAKKVQKLSDLKGVGPATIEKLEAAKIAKIEIVLIKRPTRKKILASNLIIFLI